MPCKLKSASFRLVITVLLLFMLTGCDFLNHAKPDAVIEIDLNKPGKNLRKDLYGFIIEDINRYTRTKGIIYPGNLNTALDLATSMIIYETLADSLNITSTTATLASLKDLNENQYMIVDNSTQSYKTPSYYALKMFYENRPDKVMATKVSLQTKDSSGKGIFAIAGIHEKSGIVIIKMVNSLNTPRHCQIVLNYKNQIKYKGEVIVLTSGNSMDGNSFKEPEKVVPMTKDVNGLRNTFNYECPANAVVIIHLRYKKGINGFVNCC